MRLLLALIEALDSTIDEMSIGSPLLRLPQSPASATTSSTTRHRRNAGNPFDNSDFGHRSVRAIWLEDSQEDVRLQSNAATTEQVTHLIHGCDPSVAIVVRAPAFERTHEVILFDLASITLDKLKRLVEKVFLADEAYRYGGNIHIADRNAFGEIQRLYVKRCTGDISEVIEVHEGNVKAAV